MGTRKLSIEILAKGFIIRVSLKGKFTQNTQKTAN